MNKALYCRRRGAGILVALVCLILAATLVTITTRTALLEWRSAREETYRLQAAWLVDSGIERARARLASDVDYTGESWQIPAKTFNQNRDAVVRIEVSTVDAQPEQRTIRVQADYPDDPVHRVRKTKEITVALIPNP